MTITPTILKSIITDQKHDHKLPRNYITRDIETKLKELSNNDEIIVLTGLRRAGKSVLLQLIRTYYKKSDYYFNFEDDRLSHFTSQNFQLLYETFIEIYGIQQTFFFDEIQNIKGWETFVRRLYNAGCKIYITGSNANLFSQDLGTRLTGRYIPVTIYPLSFHEYVGNTEPSIANNKHFGTKEIGVIKNLFGEFIKHGGIPEYVKRGQKEYLHTLYESIIYRDIVTRYKLKDATLIKNIAHYLASNIGKEITANSLKNIFGVANSVTISHYLDYLQHSFLFCLVNRYHKSLKTQLRSPRKNYIIDPAMANLIGFRHSDDYGRMLENIIFLELKRRGHELFYFSETNECDFIVQKNNTVTSAIQVSLNISNSTTRNRELIGLKTAMKHFNLQEGFIITQDEEETIFIETDEGNKDTIHIIPAYKWLLT